MSSGVILVLWVWALKWLCLLYIVFWSRITYVTELFSLFPYNISDISLLYSARGFLYNVQFPVLSALFSWIFFSSYLLDNLVFYQRTFLLLVRVFYGQLNNTGCLNSIFIESLSPLDKFSSYSSQFVFFWLWSWPESEVLLGACRFGILC